MITPCISLRYHQNVLMESRDSITDDHAAELVQMALGVGPRSVTRQSLTLSGNAVFRAALSDDQSVVLRVSPKPGAFAYTHRNLKALRELGLPVQNVLAEGPTATGGSFIILDWLRGRDLMYELPLMRPDQMTRLAETLVEFQRRVGTLPAGKGFGWAPIGKSAATARWTDIFGTPGTSAAGHNASPLEKMRHRLRAVRESVEPYFSTIAPTCFLDDLTLKNVLVEHGELTGVIDIDFVCYGDPLMSVGITMALIAAEVGGAGRFYGEELVRCWKPSPDGLAAIRFYTALWCIGMVSQAETAGDAARINALMPAAEAMLRLAENALTPVVLTTDQLLKTATDRHRSGNRVAARPLYERVLATAPDNVLARFRMGLLELQDGNHDTALKLIEQCVAAAPAEARYQFGLGETFAALHRWPDAAAAYRRVLAMDPHSADAHFALGNALQQQADYPGAIAAYLTAVQIQPHFADAFNNLGNCHRLTADLQSAETAYRGALALRPDFAGAASNLGTVLQETGQMEEAMKLLRLAVDLEPGAASHAINLGAMLCRQRQFGEAAALLRRALELDDNNADAAYNLGNALHGLGQSADAVEQYQKTIALRPDHADALNNLGNVYKELGEFQLAGGVYESAMRARPNFISAINNFGCLLRSLGRLEEAEVVLRRGLEVITDHPALQDNLGNVLKDAGRLDEAIECFRKAVSLDPTAAATHSNLVYSLSFSATQPAPILEQCLRWNARHAEPLRSEIRSHSTDRIARKRFRIGYVSPDFRDHCQSLFTIPLLSNHDHQAFEIFCYSSVERPDECTRRISQYADTWRDVRMLDDAALADVIRNDRIDILVDLTMHMANGRPLVFARKPAPIQIAWLAYPGTTGISAMDYRFTDPRLDPPGFQSHYTERTIHLPDSFWCYDPLCDQPGVNDLPALSRGWITLGCLNNPCKLSDHTLNLWSPVMRALPTARLMLMAPPGSPRQHILRRLAAHGIAGARVDFVPYRPRDPYLRTYHEIDLGLDTFPYNGHTTTLDSFWMGVPVVTRVGQTCVGRGGLSQLHSLNLLELAAETDEAFVANVIALASNLPRLASLRAALRDRLAQSPLMDARRFTRNIEAAYVRLL